VARAKLRKLVVDESPYLWRVESVYIRTADGSHCARTTFVVYLNGYNTSPARICFTLPADAMMGAPLNSGYQITLDSGLAARCNLNEPRSAAALVRLLRQLGWAPESGRPYHAEDATELLPRLLQS
jgi:hypothetical protein